MSSTFFTEPPHWRWLIILYFFFGGLAGGCYVLASMLDLMGRPSDRPLARLGYLLAFPTVVVCGILLIADLGRPERFWHMMLQSATWRPMLKTYSPMSLGAWGLLVFLVLELLTLAALVVSLGSLARVWLNAWGALLVLGVVGIGIVVPLLLHAGAHTPVSPTARLAAVLVLVGGFLLRVVIVLSSEA